MKKTIAVVLSVGATLGLLTTAPEVLRADDAPNAAAEAPQYPDNAFQAVPRDYLFNEEAPRGKVERFDYATTDHSKNGQTEYKKSALVYLPPDYDPAKSYNVLYLMHGGGDSPEWFFGGEGKSSPITRMLDVMLAKREIEPLIICAVSYYEEYEQNAATNCNNFYLELMKDVIPAFETKYKTFAPNVSEEGLKASRRHRAFSGFSMGAAATWSVFENCLNEIAYYMPISGDCWTLAVRGGGLQSEETAKRLAERVKASEKTAKDFIIYSGCGERDIAEANLTPQINAMKALGDPFVYCDNFANGNLYQCVNPDGGHDVRTVTTILYNGLPKMFK